MLKKFAQSFLIYGFASGLNKSLMIVLVPLYTHVFSTSEYGIVDLLAGFVALMVIIGMLQMESAVARYYYEVEETRREIFLSSAFWIILIFSIVISSVVFFLAEFFSLSFFERADLVPVIRIACILIPFTNIFTYLLVLLRYEKKPWLYAIFIFLQIAGTFLFIFYFIYIKNYGIKGVLIGQILGVAIPLVCLMFYFRKTVQLRWDGYFSRQLLKYSLPLVPTLAISWANIYFSRFLMLKYLSVSDIGIYSLAVRIASLFSLIEVAFSLTWGPFFWNSFSQKKYYSVYLKIFNTSCILIFILVASASIFSKELILLFATNDYVEASQIIGILFLSNCTTIFIQIVGLGPSIIKRTHYTTFIVLGGFLINLFLLFILINTYNLIGVAIASLGGSLITLSLFWIVSEKLFPIGYSKIFFSISFFIAAGIVITCTVYNFNLTLRLLFLGIFLLILLIYTMIRYKKIKKYLNHLPE